MKCAEAGCAVDEQFVTAFPDLRFEILEQVELGGTVSVLELVGRGTHTGPLGELEPTGLTAATRVCNVVDIRDGLIRPPVGVRRNDNEGCRHANTG